MTRLRWGMIGLLACPGLGAAPCAAAERISLHLGGYSKWWAVGAWQQTGPSHVDTADIKGDTEIHVLGRTTLDNGLIIGIKTELEAGGHTDQNTDTIDKAFVWIEGGWGKLELGTDYNAASLLHVCAPDAAGLWNGPPNGVMSDTVIPRPAPVSTMYSGNQTELDHDDNSDKLLYFTPSLHGISLALSYTPSALSEDDRGIARRSQVWAAGVLVDQKLGDAALALSAGFLTGDLDAPSATTRETVTAGSVGAQISLDGITIGASYGNERHATPGRAATATTESSTGHSVDVGVLVTHGPTSVSLAHYRSAVRGLVSQPGDDRVTVTQLSAKHLLGEGVAVMGALAHVAYDDEVSRQNSSRGFAVMSGVGLWF